VDACVAGTCTGSSLVACAALDQCHDTGACDPATGLCANPSKPDGALCNDGTACTTIDTCAGGTCVSGPLTLCAPLDQCHDGGICDPATGACSNPAKTDGVACNDGDACTQSDSCTAGTCTGSNAVVCAAKDECHEVGACAAATGVCSDPAKADGTPCSNGTCQGGVCKDSTTGSGGGGSGAGGSTTGSGGSTTGSTGDTTGVTGASTTGAGGGGFEGDVVTSTGCGCRTAGSEGEDCAPAALACSSSWGCSDHAERLLRYRPVIVVADRRAALREVALSGSRAPRRRVELRHLARSPHPHIAADCAMIGASP
ncbi:MAG: hypothetical protein ABI193_18805, partial [Minicystis sp.]